MSQPSIDVDVRGIAAGGAGVADLPDGRVIFVPRTTAGDRARVHVEKSRPRWARGSLVTLLEASPERVEAPCTRYAECGGCQLQHLAYEDQLKWKGRFVADALTRIGGLEDVVAPEVVPSPKRLHYRNRVSYTLRRVGKGHVVAGFHALHRPAHVVDIRHECLLPEQRLTEAWVLLRERWGRQAEHLPTAGRMRLTLRLAGPDRGDVDLVVEGGRPGWNGLPLFEAVAGLRAIWHMPVDKEGEPAVGESHDRATTKVGTLLVAGSPEESHAPAFSQVNDDAAEALRTYVLECCLGSGSPGVGVSDTRSAVDAYCGTGAYGLSLAAKGWQVTGIESDPVAAAHARASVTTENTSMPGRLDVREGRVEDLLTSLLPTDLLLLNPPRGGLAEDVPTQVLEHPPGRIVYVSCDPATLARDLKRLNDQYALDGIRSFDLFPQTAHVETVAELSLRSTIA